MVAGAAQIAGIFQARSFGAKTPCRLGIDQELTPAAGAEAVAFGPVAEVWFAGGSVECFDILTPAGR